MYGRYTQEPFYLRPWEIARLTDWQLENLYAKPAERLYREQRGLSPAAPQAGGDNGSMPADREQFVQWWQQHHGGTREEALKKHAEEFGNG